MLQGSIDIQLSFKDVFMSLCDIEVDSVKDGALLNNHTRYLLK